MIAVPDLDTIDFEALVNEGRGLIPRYAPDWTDHNLHDPGMTLLDLLAWFVDQQMFRIGFVSDAHIAAFAALVGVTRQPAKAAEGLIWPDPGALATKRELVAGQRVQPREQPELAFLVTDKIGLRAARIARVEARIKSAVRVQIPADTGAILLDDGTDTIDLVLAGDPLADGGPEIALGLAFAEPLPGLGTRPPATAYYRDGAGALQRAVARWNAAPDGMSGVLLLTPPAAGSAIAAIRLDLDSNLPRRLVPVRVALNVIPVAQIEILEALKIGEGTGWPDLELSLGLGEGATPVEPISITAGPGDDRWTACENLSVCSPEDDCFLFDGDRGIIRFGNGVNGRAMPLGCDVSRAALRVTLGARGNLAAGTSWTTPGGTRGFGQNQDPMTGGADAWTREDLLGELHRRARKRATMLTDGDLMDAATGLKGYGVERAEVLPRFLPALPHRDVPGTRTLLLRPTRKVDATDAWLDAIAGSLAPNRVLGERLTVVAVDPVAIEVEVTLLVAAGSDHERIRDEARQRLRERLSVSKQRDGQDIEPWPAGRPVTLVELETLLASIKGVVAVANLLIARAGEALARVSLPLSRIAVATVGEPVIQLEVER